MGAELREQGETYDDDLALGRVGTGLAIVGYVVFWGWLVLRWLNNWFLPPGVGVPPDVSFVDPATVAPISDSLAFAVRYLPALANGVWMTIVLTLASIVLGFVIAVPVALMRVYGGYTRYASLVYTEVIRGTPLIAQLFLFYYGIKLTPLIRQVPNVGQGFVPDPAFFVAIVAFTINSSAYQGEYIRSALISIKSGQMAAARSVGLSKLQAIRYVILPQGLRYAIPGWSNELVYLIKYSSVAAFITVGELFNAANQVAAENYRFTGIFTLVAIMYLGIVITASSFMDRVEKWTSIPGLSVEESQ